VAEAIAGFLLITAIMSLAVDKRAPGGWAGLMIGLSVSAAILMIGPLTGASLREFDEPEPAQGTQGDIEGRRDPLPRTAG
jgi:hypothetical protein